MKQPTEKDWFKFLENKTFQEDAERKVELVQKPAPPAVDLNNFDETSVWEVTFEHKPDKKNPGEHILLARLKQFGGLVILVHHQWPHDRCKIQPGKTIRVTLQPSAGRNALLAMPAPVESKTEKLEAREAMLAEQEKQVGLGRRYIMQQLEAAHKREQQQNHQEAALKKLERKLRNENEKLERHRQQLRDQLELTGEVVDRIIDIAEELEERTKTLPKELRILAASITESLPQMITAAQAAA